MSDNSKSNDRLEPKRVFFVNVAGQQPTNGKKKIFKITGPCSLPPGVPSQFGNK